MSKILQKHYKYIIFDDGLSMQPKIRQLLGNEPTPGIIINDPRFLIPDVFEGFVKWLQQFFTKQSIFGINMKAPSKYCLANVTDKKK